MKLSEGQRKYLRALAKVLSIDALHQLKKGNMQAFEDLNLKLINPDSDEENQEMRVIVDDEISLRQKKLNKIIH